MRPIFCTIRPISRWSGALFPFGFGNRPETYFPSSKRTRLRSVQTSADTGKLNLATAITARARHLVFLERRPAGAAVVEPIPVEETLRRLDAAVFFGNEAIRRNQRATLRHFASLPSVLLRYSDLAEAEAALRALPVDEA